ncbi:MAG: hypothetical protein R3B45_04675 [Bdellovibrionota bacterium]
MANISNIDIIVELMELAVELMGEVRQQLSYFRASVYKEETAELVRAKIEKLRFVINLFPGELMYEPFHDYDAELNNPALQYIPGECSFTSRVSRLLDNIQQQMAHEKQSSSKSNAKINDPNHEFFLRKIRDQRLKIMSICRHGSRQWSFFQRV